MHLTSQVVKTLRRLCLIGLTLAATACASLPELHYLDGGLDAPSVPTVTNARGALGSKKSASLLAKHWKNSHVDVAALAALEEAVTHSPLIAGNKVSLLYDGPQTMAAMTDAIRAAKDHINLETYIFDQDELGIRFADLLIERQRAGVQVNIIYDSVGTLGTPQEFFDKMKAAGIQLLAYNPVNPLKLVGQWHPNNRDHRKILVVDGLVAFTGGVNISSTYSNGSLFHSGNRHDSKVGWRDTHIKIEGPAVAALQWVFLNDWTDQNAAGLADSDYFPKLTERGDKLVRVLASEPDGDQEVYKAYVLAIQQARKTIHITSAYFVPDAQILKALEAAARRGVEVKIILPGVSDSGLVRSAMQSFYTEMLAGGIKIFQLQIAVLRAKTAVIDKVWSTVSSTNMDTRSFLHNKEINVVVFDEEFGTSMEAAFAEDLRYSVEMTAEKWEHRPAADHLKEWAARRLAYWL
jgi:cardiolipin synthase